MNLPHDVKPQTYRECEITNWWTHEVTRIKSYLWVACCAATILSFVAGLLVGWRLFTMFLNSTCRW